MSHASSPWFSNLACMAGVAAIVATVDLLVGPSPSSGGDSTNAIEVIAEWYLILKQRHEATASRSVMHLVVAVGLHVFVYDK